MQNGYCESFNGRMCDELLNESLFFGIDHARQKLREWVADYNTARPHSSLGYKTPAAYAAHLAACVDGPRTARRFLNDNELVGAVMCPAFACGLRDRWP